MLMGAPYGDCAAGSAAVALRYFDLTEATGLLPRLREMLGALRRLRDEAILKKTELDLLWQKLEHGAPVLTRLGEEQQALDHVTSRLVAVAREIEATGCVLRDVDRGLVDFACRARDGNTVFLCWHLDEPAIAFWHGVNEGYGGRRPIADLRLDEA
jgi:hypothetical protein